MYKIKKTLIIKYIHMAHETNQESKSVCCEKWMNHKFLKVFLAIVVVLAIFVAGFCAGFRGRFERGEGQFGRRGGMMQQGQWGNGQRGRGMMRGYPQGNYGQPGQDQTAPDQGAAVPTTSTTATPKQ